MKIITNSAIAIALTLSLSTQTIASSSSTNEGDAAKGEEIAAGVCAGCHNADGNSIIPINPSLAGQNAAYIVKQLMDFKAEEDGERMNVSELKAKSVTELTEIAEDLAVENAGGLRKSQTTIFLN